MTQNSDKLLTSKQAIMDYLEMSEHTMRKFIGMGLPIKIIDSRYYAHKDNLDRFFEDLTAKKAEASK